MGLTAPPIGLNVFVVSAIAVRTPIAQTYRGVLPFLLADLVRLAALLAFPVLALGMDTIDDATIAATLGVVLKHQSDQQRAATELRLN
jgi:hypothetical protein